jgi:integrase
VPRRRNEERRILGPYHDGGEIRYVVVNPRACEKEDQRRSYTFTSEAEAQGFIEGVRAEWATLDERTVTMALELYLEHLERKGTGEISRTETARRLRLFFSRPERLIAELNKYECSGYYDAFAARRKRDGGPISVDYHRNTLAEARSFLRWCVGQGWMRTNPLDEVKGVGRRESGKDQLTGDEARKLYSWCLARAQAGDEAALGVLMLLLMGLRSSDITKRIVRDVDLDGTVLRVGLRRGARSKSKKGDRARNIPPALQPIIKSVIGGRDATEPLFKASNGGFRTTSWARAAMHRLSAAAGVPYVCPHGLKGTGGTILAEDGELAERIQKHLSHEDIRTSERHYIASGALEQAQADRVLQVIEGGKR